MFWTSKQQVFSGDPKWISRKRAAEDGGFPVSQSLSHSHASAQTIVMGTPDREPSHVAGIEQECTYQRPSLTVLTLNP